jgi:hypothetical protein
LIGGIKMGRVEEIVLKAENAGLKKENELIKVAYDDRIQDIQWLSEDVKKAIEIFKDIQEIQTWDEWDALKISDRVKNFIDEQKIIN